jgi:hypothetical protein
VSTTDVGSSDDALLEAWPEWMSGEQERLKILKTTMKGGEVLCQALTEQDRVVEGR